MAQRVGGRRAWQVADGHSSVGRCMPQRAGWTLWGQEQSRDRGGWGTGQGHSLCMQPESVLTHCGRGENRGLETHLTGHARLRPEA